MKSASEHSTLNSHDRTMGGVPNPTMQSRPDSGSIEEYSDQCRDVRAAALKKQLWWLASATRRLEEALSH